MTKELPHICSDGEHDFRPINGVTLPLVVGLPERR